MFAGTGVVAPADLAAAFGVRASDALLEAFADLRALHRDAAGRDCLGAVLLQLRGVAALGIARAGLAG
ncbi:hypothetical protein [Nonomuraea sp. SYSU D8015]|uniref:hypothetical protein n=1 Tax=Nonomuraea sp. SYSU D8015 TaxID=2593644 RepID=UPI001660FD73|nr:hypothetical protein [Nonomuraea sp. SYSU D8015]